MTDYEKALLEALDRDETSADSWEYVPKTYWDPMTVYDGFLLQLADLCPGYAWTMELLFPLVYHPMGYFRGTAPGFPDRIIRPRMFDIPEFDSGHVMCSAMDDETATWTLRFGPYSNFHRDYLDTHLASSDGNFVCMGHGWVMPEGIFEPLLEMTKAALAHVHHQPGDLRWQRHDAYGGPVE